MGGDTGLPSEWDEKSEGVWKHTKTGTRVEVVETGSGYDIRVRPLAEGEGGIRYTLYMEQPEESEAQNIAKEYMTEFTAIESDIRSEYSEYTEERQTGLIAEEAHRNIE